jgi:predicted Zn-dependent protease
MRSGQAFSVLYLMNIVVLTVAAGGISGCSDSFLVPANQPKYGQNCRIAEDQKDAFMPRLSVASAVTVLVDRRFTEKQQTDIQQAISVWNAFAGQSLKRTFFRTELGTIGAGATPDTSTDCEYEENSVNSFYIVRENSAERWKALMLTEANPAATMRCKRGDELIKQVVMVNTGKNFLRRPEQLVSVILHELGHSLGLDHSCTDKKGNSRYASCQELQLIHPYRIAVMYPTLMIPSSLTESPEKKEDLRLNDLERTHCLYSDTL